MTSYFLESLRTNCTIWHDNVGTDALVCPPSHPNLLTRKHPLDGQTRASVPTLRRCFFSRWIIGTIKEVLPSHQRNALFNVRERPFQIKKGVPLLSPVGTSPPPEGLGKAFNEHTFTPIIPLSFTTSIYLFSLLCPMLTHKCVSLQWEEWHIRYQ